jgi:hypothetical protein
MRRKGTAASGYSVTPGAVAEWQISVEPGVGGYLVALVGSIG